MPIVQGFFSTSHLFLYTSQNYLKQQTFLTMYEDNSTNGIDVAVELERLRVSLHIRSFSFVSSILISLY